MGFGVGIPAKSEVGTGGSLQKLPALHVHVLPVFVSRPSPLFPNLVRALLLNHGMTKGRTPGYRTPYGPIQAPHSRPTVVYGVRPRTPPSASIVATVRGRTGSYTPVYGPVAGPNGLHAYTCTHPMPYPSPYLANLPSSRLCSRVHANERDKTRDLV